VIAAYASIGPGSRVLKVWKTSQNRSLDRVLLAGVRRAVRTWQNEEELSLIPIPQSTLRRWELFGGSTLRLCEMIRIARKEMGLRTSILDILEARLGANADPADGALSQAKTRGAARYGKAAVFLRRGSGAENPGARLGESRSGPYVIVDDFLTSGSTLRRALAALRSEEGSEKSPFAGAAFDAFVLGFRPSFFTETGTKETEPPSR
jgi:predicted amidophosphoribosyltransferase